MPSVATLSRKRREQIVRLPKCLSSDDEHLHNANRWSSIPTYIKANIQPPLDPDIRYSHCSYIIVSYSGLGICNIGG